MNITGDFQLSQGAIDHLASLDCPFDVRVKSDCEEWVILEDVVVQEDERGFFIELTKEDVLRLWGHNGRANY